MYLVYQCFYIYLIITLNPNLHKFFRPTRRQWRSQSIEKRNFVATARQNIFPVEGAIFCSHQGLFAMLQKRHIKDHRDGRFYLWHPTNWGMYNLHKVWLHKDPSIFLVFRNHPYVTFYEVLFMASNYVTEILAV